MPSFKASNLIVYIHGMKENCIAKAHPVETLEPTPFRPCSAASTQVPAPMQYHEAGATGDWSSNNSNVLGRDIGQRFPHDLHFIVGCANFDPLGHNEKFRSMVASAYFRRTITNNSGDSTSGDDDNASGSVKVRGHVAAIVECAHQYARLCSGTPLAQFRVWKPILEPKKRLKESTWQETPFEDITDNIGSLKRNLEWPLRKALQEERDKLDARDGKEDRDSGLDSEPSAKRRKLE